MKMSPCNEESCAEGIRSACAEQVLRDVFGASCAAPEPFEKTRDDRLFSLYAFLRKYAVVIVCLERAAMGFYKCTLFSESAALYNGNIPTT